jgi:hypothetical protein
LMVWSVGLSNTISGKRLQSQKKHSLICFDDQISTLESKDKRRRRGSYRRARFRAQDNGHAAKAPTASWKEAHQLRPPQGPIYPVKMVGAGKRNSAMVYTAVAPF